MFTRVLSNLSRSQINGAHSCFNFKVIPSVTTVRQLTQAQTSEALRPFLFAVHPDFFGKYPKERAINEHSLKQLFAYIDGLKQRGNVSPTHLTFYLRNQQHKEPEKPPAEQPKPTEPTPPRAVNISLLGNDIFSTVSHVLKSCDISTNHVKQSSSPHHDFYRPIEWHHTYYTYTAKRNPFEGYPPSKPDVTLRYFLRRNIPKARKHLHLSSQCRDEAQSHEKRLITNLQLCNISWQSSWNVSAYRTCLKALDRLCQSNKSVAENLKGRHVVFGNRSMLGCDGSIRLSSEDVPQQWQMFLSTLPRWLTMLDEVALLEEHFSKLLGGCRVDKSDPILSRTPVEEHCQCLQKVISSIQRYYHTRHGKQQAIRIPPGRLKEVRVTLYNHSRILDISDFGLIQIGVQSNPEDIVHFLMDRGVTAREMRKQKEWDVKAEEDICRNCQEELDLSSLTKDITITTEQMISCCTRITRNPLALGVTMNDLRLHVTKYFSVLKDGEICLPWDWKE
ncbi:T-cell activation inhibitor, mitochondrial-like [Apostichopus japonicus]|uniref:T-cell activation inhibitor, mitochondrial-like n=1 Tax=Stichopus japonicus TaxID=307972 RepID=UPI003AB12A74